MTVQAPSTPALTIQAPAPPGTIETIRHRYFSSVPQAIVTILCLALIVTIVWKVLDWAVVSAVFDDRRGPAACQAASGACWAVIAARWRIILFGLYPYEEQWRSALACVIVVVMTVVSCVPAFWTGRRIATVWVAGTAAFYLIMKGGFLGLPYECEEVWGGLALTLFIFVTVCLIGFPLSIGLALLRRSELPWISHTTAVLIDSVRSLPLVSILFTAAVVLPFALPDWLQTDKLYRVILGDALFFAAYQAEILRGGMQGVPNGQEEAGKALGLGYWERVSRILMPQAMRNALPAAINQFVISFKETSLVVIVGFFDVMASGNAAYGTGDWRFAYVEVYVFIALIYFTFVFSLSRYGAYIERRMAVGTR